MRKKSIKSQKPMELSLSWATHLKNWSLSSVSQSEYCRRNNLNYSVFHYWKRKLSKSRISGSSSNLVQFAPSIVSQNNSCPTPGRASLRLWVGRDYCVDVEENFSEAVLSRLLACLRRL